MAAASPRSDLDLCSTSGERSEDLIWKARLLGVLVAIAHHEVQKCPFLLRMLEQFGQMDYAVDVAVLCEEPGDLPGHVEKIVDLPRRPVIDSVRPSVGIRRSFRRLRPDRLLQESAARGMRSPL